MTTAILGGGIIGLSTAYFLSQFSKSKIIVIDASPLLLASASGFAGGFLARDWFSPAVSELGALSFDLHKKLADENEGQKRWGYSGSTALSLAVDAVGVDRRTGRRGENWLVEGTSRAGVAVNGSKNGERGANDEGVLNEDGSPRWVRPQENGTVDVISGEKTCAQVEPMRLSEFLIEHCEEKGVEIRLSSKPVGVVKDQNGNATSVKVERDGKIEEVECTNIVITAGAWTPRVFKDLFPESKITIPIGALAGHSCVIRSRHLSHHTNPNTLTNLEEVNGNANTENLKGHHAVFCAPGPQWKTFAPEAISRVGRCGEAEVCVAGLNSSTMPLPELATETKIDEESRMELRRVTRVLTGDAELDIVREAVCFRPVVVGGGGPIIGRVDDVGGGNVFVASGHGPWGISLSLGTGKVVSEMVEGKRTSADVRELGKRLR